MAEHKMTNLQRTPAEDKKEMPSLDGDRKKPYFPLSLYVHGPEIAKLGLEGVQVGEEHDLVAKVKVTGVSITDREGSEKRESVDLTLVEGAIYSDHGEDAETRAKKVYDGK
ncbi:MAG: hypothetical protein IH957_13560 [Chloroflexi bacterium]|nr:hypothetical protein [Chloroflexota bacterium]